MAKVPDKKLVKLGQVLREARMASELDQGEVVCQLNRAGLRYTQSYISQCEAGQFVNPSPQLLRGFAKLYKLNYKDLVAAIIHEKYGVDFTKGEAASKLSILMIERELTTLKKRIAKLKKGR